MGCDAWQKSCKCGEYGLFEHLLFLFPRFVTCCAFSGDGSHLATGSMDRTVKIWKLTDTSGIMCKSLLLVPSFSNNMARCYPSVVIVLLSIVSAFMVRKSLLEMM